MFQRYSRETFSRVTFVLCIFFHFHVYAFYGRGNPEFVTAAYDLEMRCSTVTHVCHVLLSYFWRIKVNKSHIVALQSQTGTGHIYALFSCSVITAKDLSFYFSSSFIRPFFLSSICVVFVQLPNNQCSEPFSLLFTSMLFTPSPRL